MKKKITPYSLNQMYPIPVPGSYLVVNENGYCYVDTDNLLGVVYSEEDRKEFEEIWKEREKK